MSAKLQPSQIRRISAQKPWFVLAVLGITLLLGSSLLLWQQSNRSPLPEAAPLTVADLLGNTGTEGYARALEPRPFRFPADHGPHADFRSEWWYLTGNLQTPEGRHFGYQFTIFRSRLTPPSKPTPETSTLWTTAQAYLAHLALTDTESGRFHFFERFSRDSAGLAGAQAEPFRVWVENWRLSRDGSAPDFPLTLHAETPEVALHLKLRAAKPLVLQGDRGFSLKGHQPGNASYYYSYPRMITSGTVTLNGTSRVVSGSSWMDREWSSSALESGQVGWDWFALQFSNGAELMYYRLRRRDGFPDTTSRGIWMAPDGNTTALEFGSVNLAVEASWTSPHTGTIYPAAWRLHAPELGLDATITPRLADQEIRGAIHYWEGAVQVEGTLKGQPLRGVGYVELTGYGD